MSVYFPLGKYKLSVCSFLEYCYKTARAHNFSCFSERCLVDYRNVHKVFQPWTWEYQDLHLNSTIISDRNVHKVFQPWTWEYQDLHLNNTIISVLFFKSNIFFHYKFSFSTPSLTAFKTWQNTETGNKVLANSLQLIWLAFQ